MMRPLALAALAALSVVTLAAGPRLKPVTQLNPAVTITVDAGANRHAIDPRIYGVAFEDATVLSNLGLTLNRWGGNATSRYNWANSTSNHARDYFFENVPDNVVLDGSNGESADMFIQPTLGAGAQPIMTIPMLGYLPVDRVQRCGYSVTTYGPQGCCWSRDDPFHHDCGDGFDKNSPDAQHLIPLKHINSPLDISTLYTSAHQGNWLQHIVNTFGPASTTGVKYYALDNEPGLWDSTHFDIHPDPSTYDDIWTRMQDYGAVIKSRDPSAQTMGPEEWGWLGYFDSTADWNANPSTTADRDAHGGVPLIEWLLQQSRDYERTHGTRILDIASVHYYPQGLKGTNVQEFAQGGAVETTPEAKLLRNQSTRSLWDPNYVDQSWISDLQQGGVKVRLIPRMREWVNTNYPGTKIAIAEYNWGAENDISGATAQADILGIFGREGLDIATRWPTKPPMGAFAASAFKMYRNYDGAHSTFGDVSVSASAADPDKFAAFAALRTSDRVLTIMLVAKDPYSGSTPVTVNLSNFAASNVSAYQLDGTNAITPPIATVNANAVSVTVASPSVTILVVTGSYLDAPATVANATGTSTATITWNAIANATSYTVQRSTSLTDPAPQTFTTSNTSFNDSGLAANTTYLYRVQATNGSIVSGFGALDPATTINFTDEPLNVGTVAKSAHVNELRTAVNAMRLAAVLGTQTWTDDPSVTTATMIKAQHIIELRAALDQARAKLGLSAGTWSDPAITAGVTPIRAAHIIAIRNGVK